MSIIITSHMWTCTVNNTVLPYDYPQQSLYYLSFISHYCHERVLPNCLLCPKLQLQSLSFDPADRRPDSYITLIASHAAQLMFGVMYSPHAGIQQPYTVRDTRAAVFTLSWCLWQDSHDAEEQRRQLHNGQSCTSSGFPDIKSVVSLFPHSCLYSVTQRELKQVLLLWQACETAVSIFFSGP